MGRQPPPELPHPDEIRAALKGVEQRATAEVTVLKGRYRKWVLAAFAAYIVTLVGLGVSLAFIYGQSQRIVSLQQRIVSLQQAQTESSKNGRTLLQQVANLTQRIVDYSDPNSKIGQEQRAQTAQVLAQLDAAQRAGRADQLKKIAQMFEQCRSLPCDPAIVNRILAQPVPVPTFGGAPARASGSTVLIVGNPPASPGAVPSPQPSSTVCPGIQVAPLNLARICIPP